MDFLQGLNDKQKEAVLHTEGPLLIMAGAGSGKTRVVTHKIAYLLEEKNVFPGNILAITFTNKAADEMKTRVADLLDVDVDKMWMGTFHSICVRILRRDIDKIGYTRSFTIYDRDDQVTLIRECIKEQNLDKDMYKEGGVLARISAFKDSEVDPDEFINANYKDYRERNIGELYALYQKKLKQYNALDFDDLLIKAVELLRENPSILEYYQKRFQYIFVDEYQDTNKIQYKLVKLLSQWHGNICVVGDPDQSIYSWRQADITNILDFERDFKGAEIILLEQNYRSTQNILKIANEVIKRNVERKEKNLWTAETDGEPVIYEQCEYSEEEAYFVAKEINKLLYEGYKPSDFAILYRTNVQSRSFEEVFMSERLPYKIVGGLKFYDRKEVKDIIAYLKVIQNPNDNISLKRIINTPKRGIGAATVEKVEDYAQSNGESIYSALFSLGVIPGLSTRAVNSLKGFMTIMSNLMAKKEIMGIKDLVEDIIESTGYVEGLKKDDSIESQTRIDNIMDFVSVALNFEENSVSNDLEEFLARISLLSDVDKTEDTDNMITMMTVHSAKGLEFPVVFVVGMEEGLFPISRSLDNDKDLEEERRLCYVAITRAEKILYISNAKQRTIYGRTNYTLPSRFLNEMGESIQVIKTPPRVSDKVGKTDTTNLVNFMDYSSNIVKTKSKVDNKDLSLNIGTKIRHKKWGIGTVVQVTDLDNNDEELVIAFDNQGLKKLKKSIAPIEIV